MSKRRLVTSALPYVNNVPHLGNLIQVLSGDVFARFCRQFGYETLFVCGTDEYGTATETMALQEGVSPKELCDKFHEVHADIYRWFNIEFDTFGRTSSPKQTEIVQDIFNRVDHNGYILKREIEQLFCLSCDRFLADRFVVGECPHCHYERARGDQCEQCGKLLDPNELIVPLCGVCSKTPEIRKTKHLFLDLETGQPGFEGWMDETSKQGFWPENAIQSTKGWLKQGLEERCITRDLKWGIPVPKEGFEDKVFYVWFDAPIGYISLTAEHTDDWQRWWWNNQDVQLYQFIGKDNIPFHAVVFPYTQLCTGISWTMVHHLSSTEYLNYETGKFSKSQGTGIFGNDCQKTGIPADVWRFYIYYNRPESSDYQFNWEDFQTKVNKELIGNLGNLLNRTSSFLRQFYQNRVPELEGAEGKGSDQKFYSEMMLKMRHLTNDLEHAKIKKAFRTIFEIADRGNQVFQHAEPWKVCKEDPAKAEGLLHDLAYLLRDLSIVLRPFLPDSADKMAKMFQFDNFDWHQIGDWRGLGELAERELLFEKIEDTRMQEFREEYSGVQAKTFGGIGEEFAKQIILKSGKVLEAKQHPNAEKLFVISIDVGEKEPRTIVSGLVGFYTAEELLEREVIIVSNLKPAKLRGIESNGMVLTAENSDESELELLSSAGSYPGSVVKVSGAEGVKTSGKTVKIDVFAQFPLRVEGGRVLLEEYELQLNQETIKTEKIKEGKVS